MRARKLSALLALGIAACTQASTPAPEGEHGLLSLALVGADSHGHTYRLRDAQFQISGCPDYPYYDAVGGTGSYAGGGGSGGNSACTDTVISSEDDPNAGTITTRLIPGYYNVRLYGGWHLEELTASGPVAVDQALLLSPSTQYAYVWDRGQAQVFYSFGVGGDLIDFRHGDLTINIQVEQPGDGDCVRGYGGYGYGGNGSCGVAGSAGLPAPGGAEAPPPVDAGTAGAAGGF